MLEVTIDVLQQEAVGSATLLFRIEESLEAFYFPLVTNLTAPKSNYL